MTPTGAKEARTALLVALAVGMFLLAVRLVAPFGARAPLSSAGGGPLSLSAFRVYGTTLGALSEIRRPLLATDRFAKGWRLLIFEPTMPITTREAELLLGSIADGAVVYTSAASERAWSNLAGLLRNFPQLPAREPNPRFANGRTDEVHAEESPEFAATLSFYSPERFKGALGRDTYWQTIRHGEGALHVISGIPPFANVMLGKSENLTQMQRFFRRATRVVIDEYHHGEREISYAAFLLDSKFVLPLAALLAGIVLFTLLESPPLAVDAADSGIRVRAQEEFELDIFRGTRGTPSLAAAVERLREAAMRSGVCVPPPQGPIRDHADAYLALEGLGNAVTQHRERSYPRDAARERT